MRGDVRSTLDRRLQPPRHVHRVARGLAHAFYAQQAMAQQVGQVARGGGFGGGGDLGVFFARHAAQKAAAQAHMPGFQQALQHLALAWVEWHCAARSRKCALSVASRTTAWLLMHALVHVCSSEN